MNCFKESATINVQVKFYFNININTSEKISENLDGNKYMDVHDKNSEIIVHLKINLYPRKLINQKYRRNT